MTFFFLKCRYTKLRAMEALQPKVYVLYYNKVRDSKFGMEIHYILLYDVKGMAFKKGVNILH